MSNVFNSISKYRPPHMILMSSFNVDSISDKTSPIFNKVHIHKTNIQHNVAIIHVYLPTFKSLNINLL